MPTFGRFVMPRKFFAPADTFVTPCACAVVIVACLRKLCGVERARPRRRSTAAVFARLLLYMSSADALLRPALSAINSGRRPTRGWRLPCRVQLSLKKKHLTVVAPLSRRSHARGPLALHLIVDEIGLGQEIVGCIGGLGALVVCFLNAHHAVGAPTRRGGAGEPRE